MHLSFSVDETLDDILAGSDEEEESEQLVTQVLDEIGLDAASKVNSYNIVMTLSVYSICVVLSGLVLALHMQRPFTVVVL